MSLQLTDIAENEKVLITKVEKALKQNVDEDVKNLLHTYFG